MKTSPGTKALEVGSHIEASCGKCREMTSHVVLAKIGGKPTRVECRVCHATHQYKSGMPGTAARSATPGTARKRASGAAAANPEEVWAKAMRAATGSQVTYSTGQHFVTGQRVKHATFGEGVVTRIASPTVCEVTFQTGVRKLLMGS